MKEIQLTFHKAVTNGPAIAPLAQDSVIAGFPSPAQDSFSPEIDLNDLLIAHKAATFFVRISGESMRDAGILDGDLAIVDKSLSASDGDFVIAYVNGDFTIKQLRLHKDGKRGWLVPWNKQYPDIEVDADDDFRIWGVVTHVIHSMKKGMGHDK